MFCQSCGSPTTPGLSYCNRCGANLRERTEIVPRTGAITAFLLAVIIIGLGGLGIMVAGALALKQDAGMGEDIVGIFMFMTFLIVAITEFLLVRQLSKLTSNKESKRVNAAPAPAQHELREVPIRSLAEPTASVTDNTTRTLPYSHKEQ